MALLKWILNMLLPYKMHWIIFPSKTMQLRCSHSLIYRAVSTAKQQKRQIQEQKKLQFINYSWPFWFFNGYLYHTKHANMERKPIKTCYWIVKSIKSSLQLEKIDDIQTGSPNYGWHTKWLTGATLPYHTFFTWWAFSTSPIRRIFFVFLFFCIKSVKERACARRLQNSIVW